MVDHDFVWKIAGEFEVGVFDPWRETVQVFCPSKLTQETLNDICLWMDGFRPEHTLMLSTFDDFEAFDSVDRVFPIN